MKRSISCRMSMLSAVCALVALLASNASAVVVANSVVDFPAAGPAPVQGTNNWTYGIHSDTLDPGFSYSAGDFTAFPDSTSPGSNSFGWTGSAWDWQNGNPPWTAINAAGGHPNGSNNGFGEQWAIRRWTSEVDGAVNIDLQVNKTNVGAGSNGVTARAFVNGVHQASILIGGQDGAGRTWTFHVPDLKVGDVVDIALDPTGTNGVAHDGSDGSNWSGVVDHVGQYGSTLIGDSIAEFSGTQGANGWTNGYHNVTANGTFDATPGGTDDFIAFGPGGDPGFVLVGGGTRWDWGAGNPPWTTIDADDGHPNGTNSGGVEHWAIRRYEVEESGDLIIDAFLAAANTNGGNGTILHVLHNGVNIGSLVVGGTDGVGLRDVFDVLGAQVGDFIDLALDPNGSDGFDSSLFSARIFRLNTVPEPASVALLMLAGSALGIRRRRRTA